MLVWDEFQALHVHPQDGLIVVKKREQMCRGYCGQDVPDNYHGFFTHFDALATHQLVYCVENVVVADDDSSLIGVAGDVWEDPEGIFLP